MIFQCSFFDLILHYTWNKIPKYPIKILSTSYGLPEDRLFGLMVLFECWELMSKSLLSSSDNGMLGTDDSFALVRKGWRTNRGIRLRMLPFSFTCRKWNIDNWWCYDYIETSNLQPASEVSYLTFFKADVELNYACVRYFSMQCKSCMHAACLAVKKMGLGRKRKVRKMI